MVVLLQCCIPYSYGLLRRTNGPLGTLFRKNSSKEAVISDEHIRADRLRVPLCETLLRSIKDRYCGAPSPRPAQNYSSLEGNLLTSIRFHGKRTVPAPPWTRQKSMIELPMTRQMETDSCSGGIYPSLSIHLLSLQIDYGMVQQFAINIPL